MVRVFFYFLLVSGVSIVTVCQQSMQKYIVVKKKKITPRILTINSLVNNFQ